MPESTLAAGRTAGNYVLEAEIGRGAHGVVYRAHLAGRTDPPLALKIVESRGQRDKLLLEPQILAKLNHPGIVRLHDSFPHGSDLAVVLEFVRGETLQTQWERRGRLTAREVREFLVQMADALTHAHAAGIMHRDIKPSNILVELRDGQPRYVLTDFGISRLAGGIQVARHAGGTYLFMAPEQLRGRPGPASDLWALGVVAYALWTGQLPFSGETVEELSQAVFFRAPRRPRELVPDDGDEGLERVIFGLLEKSTSARTSSAAELREQLGAEPLAIPPEAEAGTAAPLPYERRLERQMRRSWTLCWVAAILSAGPVGFLPQALTLAGAYAFYRSELLRALGLRQSWSRNVAWLVLMGLTWPLAIANQVWLGLLFLSLGAYIPGFFIVLLLSIAVSQVGLLPAAVYFFSQSRRLHRELSLRRAIVLSSAQRKEYLTHLKSFHDLHPEDLHLHQKYVEALLAAERHREAVVEARLVLRQDAYNFGASLLLAHAYFELGLYEACTATCNAYLAVTGYCFEFAELRSSCDHRMMGATA